MKLSLLVAVAVLSVASAFAPVPNVPRQRVALDAQSGLASEVDAVGNNIAVKELLTNVESSGLLTQVAKSGLLSKAQKAGLSLSKLEPLLKLAAENKEVLILAEAATPELLPLLPKVVQVAPAALPLAANLVTVPPGLLSAVGVGCFAAAVGAIVVIPDDTVLEVAVQTLAVGTLAAAGAASLVGSAVLTKIFK